jgi:RNA polymerase primary sigma factor
MPKQGRTKSKRIVTLAAKRPHRRAVDAEGMYASEIGGHELLTSQEELSLAKQLERIELDLWKRILKGPFAQEARAAFRKLPPQIQAVVKGAASAREADLDRDIALKIVSTPRDDEAHRTEIEPLRVLLAESDRVRDRFARCNLRMVTSTIMRYGYQRTTNLALGDLIQEGNLGLLKAIPRFNYRRGLRFSTYATWWIRHYLGRARQNLGSDVRVPVHLHDLAAKVGQARKRLRQELDRPPTLAELAKATQEPIKRIVTLQSDWLKHREALPSFDSVSGEEGETPSYLASDEDPVDLVLTQHEGNCQIAAAIDKLPPMLGLVVRRRFGFGGHAEKLAEIGKDLRLSRERIRQLEHKGLVLLKQLLETTDLAA